MARGRSNIAPKSIPWDMIRALVTETYGGKIDDEEDFAQLAALVARVLTPAAFEEDFRLVDPASFSSATGPEVGGEARQGLLALPGGTSKRDFMDWVNALPEREPPAYLGLPANAEKLLLVAHAEGMCRNSRLVMDVLDEGEQVLTEAAEGSKLS